MNGTHIATIDLKNAIEPYEVQWIVRRLRQTHKFDAEYRVGDGQILVFRGEDA